MRQLSAETSAAKAPPKKSTNISLSLEVYLNAKELGINISHLCEQKLREEIQLLRERQWNEQYADFIAAYNKIIESEGIALQEWRDF